MDGRQLAEIEATRRREGGPSWWLVPLATLLAALLAVPTTAAAQQDTARARQDTVPPESPAGDTLTADTIPQDSVLTPRQRAIQRLRTMRLDPVQPDTTAADSLAMDSLAMDTLGAGILPLDRLVADSVGEVAPGDSVLAPPERAPAPGAADTTVGAADTARAVAEPPRLAPIPPDTMARDPAAGPWLRLEQAERRPREEGPQMVEAAVKEQLAALRGYVPTEYRGQAAVFWADSNQLRITGESRIAREGSVLETDSLLVYDGETDVVCGYGRPVLSGEQEPVTSDRVCFDNERDVGMAEGARTRFTRQATWYVLGANNRVYLLADDSVETLYGRKTEFTSCDLEHPHYTFRAESLKMVDGGMMVARDVTLQFEDVPVFWLPWMISPTNRGRSSGLLMPQFGVNDIVRNNEGYSRRLSNVGFYWAMNDYVSTRGTFEWWAGNWTAVEGALTYYWRRQFLQGSLNTKHYWRQQEGLPPSRELTLNTSNSWQPDERTRLRLDARYASSTDFVRRNSFDPNELNRSIRSSASANRQFDWGTVTLGADRQQQLSTEQVDWTLPSLQLSISPVTLYSSDAGNFDVTWRGSASANRKTKDVQETLIEGARDTETLQASVRQGLSFGKFSIGGNVGYREETLGPKPSLRVAGEPVVEQASGLSPFPLLSPPGQPLFGETSESLDWGASVGFQQNLWTGTTLSPNISVNGTQVRDEETRRWLDSLNAGSPGSFIARPMRVSTGANLTTAIFGFFPGVGNYSRIRHKIAPTLRWSYSPEPTTTALQDSVFGVRNLRAQNRLTLSFSQTFEAKVESDEEVADSVELGQPGEPRRLPQSEKITLLALNTSTPFVYDFVAAREDDRGFQTEQISNSIRSDLLQGLQLSMSHDLFEEGERPGDGGLAPRTFAPFLTSLNASFNIDSNFWLFQLLGLSGGGEAKAERDTTSEQGQQRPSGAEAMGGADQMGGLVPGDPDPGGDMGPTGGMGTGAGTWRASLSYSLQRSRPAPGRPGRDDQTLRGNLTFDPTEHWSVRWTTSYSFTTSEFSDHILTLSRDLHRWTANFDFLKGRNGNFAFQFRVQLRDQPDLKVDYDQRQRGTEGGTGVTRPRETF